MQALYTFGGVCLGAGAIGAAVINPSWGWCIVLGAMFIAAGVAVEMTYYK